MVPPTRTMFMPASRIAVSQGRYAAASPGSATMSALVQQAPRQNTGSLLTLTAKASQSRRASIRRNPMAPSSHSVSPSRSVARCSAGSPCVCGHQGSMPGSAISPARTLGASRCRRPAWPPTCSTASTSAGWSSTARTTTRPSRSSTAVRRSNASTPIAVAVLAQHRTPRTDRMHRRAPAGHVAQQRGAGEAQAGGRRQSRSPARAALLSGEPGGQASESRYADRCRAVSAP